MFDLFEFGKIIIYEETVYILGVDLEIATVLQ